MPVSPLFIRPRGNHYVNSGGENSAEKGTWGNVNRRENGRWKRIEKGNTYTNAYTH
jgi:hypothetical protein